MYLERLKFERARARCAAQRIFTVFSYFYTMDGQTLRARSLARSSLPLTSANKSVNRVESRNVQK